MNTVMNLQVTRDAENLLIADRLLAFEEGFVLLAVVFFCGVGLKPP
jgi:hypothetical protein